MSAWLRSIATLAVAVLAVASPASAQDDAVPPDQATAFIQDLSQKAISVLRDQSKTEAEREATFRGLLKEGFDMNFIGRFVLGVNWNRASEPQREEYQELFNEYVLKTYTARLGGFTNEEFKITGSQPAGKKDVMVHSQVLRPDGPPVTADWRLRLVDGAPKVIDVVVEGVSMSISQRQEFASVVQSKGVDGLIELLRARLKTDAPVTPDGASAGQGGT
jgi:phospholipid transport system substrate-binding protein